MGAPVPVFAQSSNFRSHRHRNLVYGLSIALHRQKLLVMFPFFDDTVQKDAQEKFFKYFFLVGRGLLHFLLQLLFLNLGQLRHENLLYRALSLLRQLRLVLLEQFDPEL